MSGENALGRGIRRIRYDTRSAVSAHPRVFLPYARYKYGGDDRVVRPETEIVIDGFQRSANTFAVVAFEAAQGRTIRLAHHLHAVAQIKGAVKLGVPTIVLIRDPDDCTISHMIRNQHATPSMILSSWSRFYERLLPDRDRVVAADFSEVTGSFGDVIRRVNAKFGTTFKAFGHTDANVAACFRLIEQRNLERNGSVVEARVARPSAQREDLKSLLRQQLDAPDLAKVRAQARAAYRAWLPQAPPRP
jgi:hypothetical protein